MHKYLPRVHLVRVEDSPAVPVSQFRTFTFRETTFIAVTAYQNEKVSLYHVISQSMTRGFQPVGNPSSFFFPSFPPPPPSGKFVD